MPTSATQSRFVIEAARPEDDAELRALLRGMPMGRAIQVTFEREPDFFRAAAIQGTQVQVFVGRLQGRIIGLGTRAIRPTYVNGELVDAGYLADLRLAPEHRGRTYVARAYRFLRELHQDREVEIYSTVIVDDNRRALETIAANRAGLPRYTPLGRVLTPAIHVRRCRPPINAEIVRGSPELLPDIVAKLNENRLQFAPAYTVVDFTSGRFPGFRSEDFYVLLRAGHIAGVAGAWDQRGFRQTVVRTYRGWLGRFRPLANRFCRAGLPTPGKPVPFFYLSFLSTDDDDAFATLLRRAYNDAVGIGYSHCVVGLHEDDPRATLLNDYGHTPFAGRIFAVSMETPPQLDGRVPYLEASLLARLPVGCELLWVVERAITRDACAISP